MHFPQCWRRQKQTARHTMFGTSRARTKQATNETGNRRRKHHGLRVLLEQLLFQSIWKKS